MEIQNVSIRVSGTLFVTRRKRRQDDRQKGFNPRERNSLCDFMIVAFLGIHGGSEDMFQSA